jgi:hypothetical protein
MADYPLTRFEEKDQNQSVVVEGTAPVRMPVRLTPVPRSLTLLFQATAVDDSIRQMGGAAQFERVARARGWTPPGSTCSACSALIRPSQVRRRHSRSSLLPE